MTAGDAERLARAQQAFRDISASALRSNEGRVEALAQALDAVERGSQSDDERAAAAAVAHQLVGSAGTFGYAHVSRLARRLERFLDGDRSDLAGLEAAREALAVIRRDLHCRPDDE